MVDGVNAWGVEGTILTPDLILISITEVDITTSFVELDIPATYEDYVIAANNITAQPAAGLDITASIGGVYAGAGKYYSEDLQTGISGYTAAWRLDMNIGNLISEPAEFNFKLFKGDRDLLITPHIRFDSWSTVVGKRYAGGGNLVGENGLIDKIKIEPLLGASLFKTGTFKLYGVNAS